MAAVLIAFYAAAVAVAALSAHAGVAPLALLALLAMGGCVLAGHLRARGG